MTVRDSVPRQRQHELEELSPFELKNELIALAAEHTRRSADTMLNAGRGNPNWVATTPRDAFFLLGQFAMTESRRAWHEFDDLGGMPVQDGIAARLNQFLAAHSGAPGADMLSDALGFATGTLGLDADEFAYEMTDGIVGDHYPVPDRMLPCAEKIAHAYLVKAMCGGKAPARPYDLFATEGGTAAMCYTFDSLQVNGILSTGDKIAIMVPIFTPYLEIPKLDRFSFDVVEVKADMFNADGFHTWQYSDAELAKIGDPAVKALYLVNPSNPPSVALSDEERAKLITIISEQNPDITIITDDVYGTFVNGFESLMSALPRNTIGVYSYSKYFGCTGWRLGVIAVNQDNIFDEMIARLPAAKKDDLARRYSSITLEPDKLRFIDRMVADSRDVALNHTAGLSLPQQVQMSMFSLFALMDTQDTYKRSCQAIIARRLDALVKGTGVALPKDPNAAHYYVELDLLSWAAQRWGDEFAAFMRENYEPVDILFRLAENHSIVLLNGGGFDGPQWSVRVSLANLPMDAYKQIGSWLADAAAEYKAEFDRSRSVDTKA